MKKITIDSPESKEVFIHACCRGINLYNALAKLGYYMDDQSFKRMKEMTLITENCRYCKKEVEIEEAIVTYSYWWPYSWYISHKDCKEKGYKEEAYECQKIDRACNDCINFKREKGNKGICLEDNSNRITFPNYAECNPCFVHRKGA